MTLKQGAPSVAKLSRCMTKRFQPDYRRYLRTVSRFVRLPTHGFPSVVAFGGCDHPGARASRLTRHSAEGRGEHSRSLFAASAYAWVRGPRERYAEGFVAFALAMRTLVRRR